MNQRTQFRTAVHSALLVLALQATAFAQTDAPAEADAEALAAFTSAEDAFEDDDFDLALRLFERSYALSSRPLLLYNIANCAERLGDLERAREAYAAFVAALPDHQRAALAQSRVAAIDAELAAAASAVTETDSRLDLRVGVPLAAAGLVLVAVGVVGLATTDDCSMVSPAGTCTERTVVATGPTTAYLALGSLALVAGVTWVIMGRSRASTDDTHVSLRVGPGGASLSGRW